jgi:transposase-like protein
MTTQKGGRRTKLTPEIQDRIYASLRAGNYACVAARLAGIAESTFYDWLEQGKRAKSGRFSESVMRAELEAEVAVLKNWRAQMPTDWRACQSFLERRFGDRWRLRKDGEQAGGGGDVYVIREEQLDELQWDAEVAKMQKGEA